MPEAPKAEPPGLPDAARILRSSTPEAIMGRVLPERIIARILRPLEAASPPEEP